MKINEIVDLIQIRNYVANSINNHSLKRDSVNQLNTTLILLDKMLVEELTGDKFKEKINFENAQEAIKEVIQTTNIKYNMKPSNKTVIVEEGKAKVT
jgi:hypothetical protein